MTAREFRLPDLGEGLTEAEILAWHVAVGDTVAVDQIVCEVETAKAAVEVPCPFGGVVVALHGAVGDVMDVGRPLISVAAAVTADVGVGVGTDNGPNSQNSPSIDDLAPEEPADRARLEAAKADGTSKSGGSGNVLIGYGTPEGEGSGRRRRRVVSGFGGHFEPVRGHKAPTPVEADAPAVVERPVRKHYAVVSPLVRRLARESGLDLADVTGTGPDGLIMRRDVEAALRAPAVPAQTTAAVPQGPDELERIPIRGLRKTVADKLTRSRREIPDATTWVDVDATALVELRRTLNADSTNTAAQRISLLALLARITLAGLARYPELNATVDVERQEIVRLRDVNLGFAAQTDRGLMVPVIHGANRMTTDQLAAEFERLTAAARAGSLGLADLTGSTFTLNNYGVYGVDGSTPIINHPEAAMLGVGRIAKKPWVVDDQLAVRSVTQLSFTFDHRVCDGGVAGGFLRYVADLVEEPGRLLRAV